MRDGQIKQTGNSRLIKGQLPSTYAEFVAKVAAGTQGLDVLFNADGWSQLPTFLNKSALLKDVTASILGLPNTAVPDDAFLALTIGVGTYGFRVKVQLADGTPVEGATVSGIEALTGSTLVTGADGVVLGKSTSKTVTIGCTSPYIDQAGPASQSVTATGTITDVTLTLTNITDIITITSSTIAKVSSMAKSVDICLVGGGGGGCGAADKDYQQSTGGGGGGGGNITNILAASLTAYSKKIISIVVGAGGAAGTYPKAAPSGNECDGSDGGATTITIGEQIEIGNATGGGGGKIGLASASPGAGGTSINGGAGGDGGYYGKSPSDYAKNGGSSTVHIFNDSSLALAGGGGGAGGGLAPDDSRPSGGSPNGGLGGVSLYISGDGRHEFYPDPGSPFGGGGGGCLRWQFNNRKNRGGDGGAYLRFHFS